MTNGGCLGRRFGQQRPGCKGDSFPPPPSPRRSATAVRAYSDAGNLRVKLGVSKELLDLPRKRQAADIEDGAPDPKDRIDYIEWVYTNKIAPKLETQEVQDAEIVALPGGAEKKQGDSVDVVLDASLNGRDERTGLSKDDNTTN